MSRTQATIVFNKSDELDKFYSKEAKEALEKQQLKVLHNNVNHSEKTVFISRVRPFIGELTAEEIIKNINAVKETTYISLMKPLVLEIIVIIIII